MLGRANRRRGLTVLVGMTLAAASVLVGTSSPAQAATAITINGSVRRSGAGRRRGGQRWRRQQPAADRLSGAAAQRHPELPVQARLRRRDADPEGGDRRGHQLDLGCGAEPRTHPGQRELQPRVRVVADGAGQGPQPEHQPGRSGLGCPGLDRQRQVLLQRLDRLPGGLAGLRRHARADHQLPGGWNEKGFNATWYKNLRSALDSRGFARSSSWPADNFGWGEADEALRDPAFGNAVSGVRQPLRLRLPQLPEQLPELRQRGGDRQAAVGQRERVGRLQRRRPGARARHQPRLHRRKDERVHQLAGHRRHHPQHSLGRPRALRWRRSPGRATTRSARAPG